ncbi:MAG TPA: hypothetical protein VFJ74_07440 [Gemmatimonadaceae bacterium]|nr:hypothetical protein [Gemmatimonadaceae bacterium]
MADHHAHHDHAPHGTDMRAAFTGLIVGGLLVGAILFSVVKATNAKYAGEKPHATEQAH